MDCLACPKHATCDNSRARQSVFETYAPLLSMYDIMYAFIMPYFNMVSALMNSSLSLFIICSGFYKAHPRRFSFLLIYLQQNLYFMKNNRQSPHLHQREFQQMIDEEDQRNFRQEWRINSRHSFIISCISVFIALMALIVSIIALRN